MLSDSLFIAMCECTLGSSPFSLQNLIEEWEKPNQNILVNMLIRFHAAYVLQALLHLWKKKVWDISKCSLIRWYLMVNSMIVIGNW